jgi:hypothetical protein
MTAHPSSTQHWLLQLHPTFSPRYQTGSDIIILVKSLNLAVRFLLELGALAGLAYWGWQTDASTLTSILLAVVTPLVAAGLWGRFIAPKARARLKDPLRATVEVVFFGGATGALAAAGAVTFALIFGAVAALSLALMFVFDQRGM